jgi:acetyl-CoA acetyltransferase family protein
MQHAVIVDAVRSPIGRRNGALSDCRADELAAHVIKGLMARVGSPVAVDEVVAGCAMQVGEQGLNIGRRTALLADIPVSVAGSTVDFQCGSGLQAVITSARQIMAGEADTMLAFGVETMTRVPLGSSTESYGAPYSADLLSRHEMISNGLSAERIAQLYGLKRSDLDQFSYLSHRKAAEAADRGFFAREIVSVPVGDVEFSRDEGIRRDTSVDTLGKLRPAFAVDGIVTAGSSSQISDGAAAVLLMSERGAKDAGLKPRARIIASTSVGSDPTLALTGPIDATRKLMARTGNSINDVDAFEVNEAFAPVVLAWQKELGVAADRVNCWGGAIALGHPLGGSGARLLTTLLSILDERGGRLGVVTICCNGGLGLALLVERLRI